VKYCASTNEAFFSSEYEAASPADAASMHASDYGCEPGEFVWVAWHKVPNRNYEPGWVCDEDNPEYWLAKAAGPFVVIDDDGNVELAP